MQGFSPCRFPYLAANSVAWSGAVLTAYILNRRVVFHSEKHVAGELASFAALRFITLFVENVLLWMLISQLDTAAFSGEISCQRDHRDRELCIV